MINVRKAVKDTMYLAMRKHDAFPELGPLSFNHLADMQTLMNTGNFSYGKLCRWLGWMQCAVVAAGVASLEDMKQINRANKEPENVEG